MTRRVIIHFVDETAVPYGDNYEYAVQVMTAYTMTNYRGINLKRWETWAPMPDGSEYIRTYSSAGEADRTHKKCVTEVIRQMDQMSLPEAEQKLKLSGLRNIDGIGGYLAQKEGITYIRKNGTWEPLKLATTGQAKPECGQCHGSGIHTNSYDMEVECDCKRGVDFYETECEPCSSGWINPRCPQCRGKGVLVSRKKKRDY